jgi:long-subunit acyl-CoA synthetase (AMP-forming)
MGLAVVTSAIKHFATSCPESLALKGQDIAITYAQLQHEVTRIAHQLQEVQAGVLAIVMDNGPAWAVFDLAALSMALNNVPLPLFFSAEQMSHAIQDAQIDFLVTDNPIQLSGLLASAGMQVAAKYDYFVAGKFVTGLKVSLAGDKKPTLAHTAKITYTSGTTGKPKGVCLSAATMMQVADSLKIATEATSNDQHLSVLPYSTLLENLAGLYVPLLAGATAICLPLAEVGLTGSSGFNPQKFLQAILKEQPSSMILTPELLYALVMLLENGAPMPQHLRFIAVGGASVSPQLLQRAQKLGLPVYEGYGLSECASVVALNTPTANKMASVGKPLSHVQLNFAEDGEILVSGAQYLGYLGQDVHAHTSVATGDIGFLDEAGFLHITGRKKNIFITSYGRNVSPEWVERELTLSPLIKQAAVFGEAKPFNVAVIVANANANISNIDLEIAKINTLLPDYARVSKYLLADEAFSLHNNFLTANGRLRRAEIFKYYQSLIEHLYQGNTHAVL